ncbi:MAG TPA: methyltransferase domain-containing protein [Actinomycetota bacterium]
MERWRTFDGVAEEYERIHAPRLADPARDLVAAAEIAAGELVLDVGTGTGVVAQAAVDAGARAVGVDESVDMLAVARRERPRVALAAATAIDLPFRDGTFDVVLGGFVLASFAKVDTALFDLLRVVRTGGRVAFSVWGDGQQDAFQDAWEELVTTVVPPRMLVSAADEATPGRERFARREALQEVLYDAGLRNVRLEPRRYRWTYARDDYVAGLGVWTSGRFVRDMLGDAGWRSFLERARASFADRFPDPLSDFRDVVLAVGVKT